METVSCLLQRQYYTLRRGDNWHRNTSHDCSLECSGKTSGGSSLSASTQVRLSFASHPYTILSIEQRNTRAGTTTGIHKGPPHENWYPCRNRRNSDEGAHSNRG